MCKTCDKHAMRKNHWFLDFRHLQQFGYKFWLRHPNNKYKAIWPKTRFDSELFFKKRSGWMHKGNGIF